MIEVLVTEDVLYHIANSCEGYQDHELFFHTPCITDTGLEITVSDEDGTQRTWQLDIREV